MILNGCPVTGVARASRSAYYHWKHQKQEVKNEKKKAIEQQVINGFKEHRRRQSYTNGSAAAVYKTAN